MAEELRHIEEPQVALTRGARRQEGYQQDMHRFRRAAGIFFVVCLPACTDEQQHRLAEETEKAAKTVGAAAGEASTALSAAARRVLKEFNLDVADLKRELDESGRIVRRRLETAARSVEAVVEDSIVTGKVKLRLMQDPEVPSMVIDVDTRSGHVTLSGRVASLDQIQRALLGTLEVDEVRAVTSALRVEPDDGSDPTKH